MPDFQEEKRISVRAAYMYFQQGKWDRALGEYEKLVAIDPMDFLVHNMIAEVHLRRGEKDKAVLSFMNAAGLLRATNNLEKAVHNYLSVLRVDPQNQEARNKIEEAVRARMAEADELVRRDSLKNALDACERLLEKLPEHPRLLEKTTEIGLRLKDRKEGKAPAPVIGEPGPQAGAEAYLKSEEVIRNLYDMAKRYEQKRAWDEAVEAYITILRFSPGNTDAQNQLRELYRRVTRRDEIEQIDEVLAERPPQPVSGPAPAAPDDLLRLRSDAEAQLRQAVEDRRQRERQKSDGSAPPVWVTETPPLPANGQTEMDTLLTQAQMYVQQNMLIEAMRLCQRVLEMSPANSEVRNLLKKIYEKKNL